ncbi:MAG: hypothetical protein E7266_07955 [Lachnospiraceae bacterium]|nr:hypothetical protein [Lachnospiraceae bacterium]
MKTFTFLSDYEGRNELKEKYGDNSLMLYALQLRFDIDDIMSVASEALTDGHNDKKCDLIFTERELGIAVVAQAYNKKNVQDGDLAPSNKASDLNAAAAWIFASNISEVPEQIKESVLDLQDAIKNEEISTIYFWYVHNLVEENNPEVKKEMNTLQVAAQKLVDTTFNNKGIKVSAIEVGKNTIEKWYVTSSRRITIDDDILVANNGFGYEISSEKWKAYVTAISGKWLRKLYLEKGDDLFSGNPRNYLGKGKRKKNINSGIINSVQEEPKNFWAYNNGITALVNNYDVADGEFTIHGITIINGAQTTGAISEADEPNEDFYIPSRFIICHDSNVIEAIINNNNKQNEILPSDLRSNDKQQERLRGDFQKYPALYYNGGRRDNKTIRNKEVFDPYLVAQTILAYHGDCVTAYNEKTIIWDDDKLYNSVFIDQLTVEHIIYVYALSRAIDEYKIMLKDKKETRTESENEQMLFLSKRGSKMLLISVVSECLENIIGVKITDSWNMKFKDCSDFDKLVDLWKQIISVILAFNNSLLPALDGGLKNKESVRNVTTSVKSIVLAIQTMLKEQLKDFVNAISLI